MIPISCGKHSNFLCFLNVKVNSFSCSEVLKLNCSFSQKKETHKQTCSKCKLQIEEVSQLKNRLFILKIRQSLFKSANLNSVPASFGKQNVVKLTVLQKSDSP